MRLSIKKVMRREGACRRFRGFHLSYPALDFALRDISHAFK